VVHCNKGDFSMKKSNIVISVKGLQKSYGKNHVLKGVNIAVERGTMLALLGPNGAHFKHVAESRRRNGFG
jgi:ABC-type transporter Mla maintaining outer membrane lipid asymmetry ATPase subunit MlaF